MGNLIVSCLVIESNKEYLQKEVNAIIHRINEDDDKLILVPENEDYSKKEIEELTYFSEQYHKSFVYKPF